jgi:hypothetical protein
MTPQDLDLFSETALKVSWNTSSCVYTALLPSRVPEDKKLRIFWNHSHHLPKPRNRDSLEDYQEVQETQMTSDLHLSKGE